MKLGWNFNFFGLQSLVAVAMTVCCQQEDVKCCDEIRYPNSEFITNDEFDWRVSWRATTVDRRCRWTPPSSSSSSSPSLSKRATPKNDISSSFGESHKLIPNFFLNKLKLKCVKIFIIIFNSNNFKAKIYSIKIILMLKALHSAAFISNTATRWATIYLQDKNNWLLSGSNHDLSWLKMN